MNIDIEHTLPKEEAKRRIQGLIAHYQEEYKQEVQDLTVDWKEDQAHIRLTARGYNTAGSLEVKEGSVHLDFYVPFLLQVFGKKIKSMIHDRVQESLA
jgi:hypothetical protein